MKQYNSYISLIPRTIEILFYGSLFAVVKPFLAQLKIPCGSLLALVAPSGHLKTTLVRMYALWLTTTDEQEISFYTHQRDKDILNMIENLQGQNFLLDDMHKITDSNESRRQERRLDTVSRHVNMHMHCANVIITGETMEERKKHYALNRRMFANYMYRNGYELAKADRDAYFSKAESKVQP